LYNRNIPEGPRPCTPEVGCDFTPARPGEAALLEGIDLEYINLLNPCNHDADASREPELS